MCIDFETATALTNIWSKTRVYEIDKGKEGVPGYYYHYLGKIDIKEGVVVLDWGSNNWEADVDLNYNESQYKTTGNR